MGFRVYLELKFRASGFGTAGSEYRGCRVYGLGVLWVLFPRVLIRKGGGLGNTTY